MKTPSINTILKEYWGYDKFRPKQEEIINSILSKKDTIALLPTGGGKSICYQVPGVLSNGVTIVISPLLSLMKDQVESLKSKNISAIAITSELSVEETDVELDKCVSGETKFMYISPEKLKSPLVQTRISLMNINLIAVDEAHCISQWGHDFRPSYLEIKEVRKILPQVPILALTATATNIVLKDIHKFLELKNSEIFQTSFQRDNLSFFVLKEEDKRYKLLQILNKIKGSCVIYVRNRRGTKEISDLLNSYNISATYYHAGIDKKDKIKRQQLWMDNECRVIVATNAFGMGIDKSNVRLVIHLDLPDSPEAYFQEAGRAGRDGEDAYAVMIYNNSDIDNLKSFHLNNLADKNIVADVLHFLYKEYRIADNCETQKLYEFNLSEFAYKNNLHLIKTYNAINILQKEDIIYISNKSSTYSKVMFIVNSEYIFRYKNKNKYLDIFISSLLRSYGGITDSMTKINMFNFSKRIKISYKQLDSNLKKLEKDNIIKYESTGKGQLIKFIVPKREKYTIGRISKSIKNRNDRVKTRIDAMISYVYENNICRNHQMLEYFDQDLGENCGICDVCRKKKKKHIYENNIESRIISILKLKELSSREIVNNLNVDDKQVLYYIKKMLENKDIKINDNNKYTLY